jgi:hypothetical protein
MNTIYIIVASGVIGLTFLSVAMARLMPDEYDHGRPRLAPARSRAIRARR